MNSFQPFRQFRAFCFRPVFKSRGFTLIEFVGVLSVLAILACLILPVVARRVDYAVWTAEAANLSAITNALVQQAVINKSVPCATNWAQSAANWMALPVAQILTNTRGNARAYLIDTNGWLGSPDALNGYTQTTNGTAYAVTNARVLIVSSIGKALSLSNGVLDATGFANIWNTNPGQKPAGLTWPGSGQDLVIQRLTFTPFFNRLILINHFPDGSAKFTLDTNVNAVSVPATNWGWDRNYLTGTSLGLSSNTVLQAKLILYTDSSYVYESGNWLAGISNGSIGTNTSFSSPGGNSFSTAALNFERSTANPATPNLFGLTASQQSLVSEMSNLMQIYTTWANTSPAFTPALQGSLGVDFNVTALALTLSASSLISR